MSYDVYIVINTGLRMAEVEDVGNYTSNVSSMWALALISTGFDKGSLRALHGTMCEDAVPILGRAIVHMKDLANLEAYRKLEPANKWGNLEGATEYLEAILVACKRHQKAQLEFST